VGSSGPLISSRWEGLSRYGGQCPSLVTVPEDGVHSTRPRRYDRRVHASRPDESPGSVGCVPGRSSWWRGVDEFSKPEIDVFGARILEPGPQVDLSRR